MPCYNTAAVEEYSQRNGEKLGLFFPPHLKDRKWSAEYMKIQKFWMTTTTGVL